MRPTNYDYDPDLELRRVELQSFTGRLTLALPATVNLVDECIDVSALPTRLPGRSVYNEPSAVLSGTRDTLAPTRLPRDYTWTIRTS